MSFSNSSFFKNLGPKKDPTSIYLETSKATLVDETIFNPTHPHATFKINNPIKGTIESSKVTTHFRAISAAKDLGVRAIDKKIPGLATSLTTLDTITNTRERALMAEIKGKSSAEALTCGAVGAGAEAFTSAVGSAALFSAAGKLTIGTGGLGLVTAGTLLVVGHDHLDRAVPIVGDFAQATCHQSFDLIKQFEKKLKESFNPLPTSTLTSLKP